MSRIIPILLMAIGTAIAVYAFFFIDTTVATANGGRTVNFDLMDGRQNVLIVSCTLAIIGAIFINKKPA